ncbi:ADP-ribosylation factor GTPase-activating protein 2-like isoform X2 [Pomacea canaliculata]|uniref:ADP-ribosylation factor GTPase-activating protein 2-like isoform X2 n=1 Tax=Pomacea canaliculata TaxID=400727 RepID=UPI000D7270A4|nr:ADP-ribosylation factor GTPase-activating protein 2-like isoform X2 [Pomacea canaliculata]
MADQPSKADIIAIFKRLRSVPTNKQCFDCGNNNPTWASCTYGVFLCIDCSAVHRSLGVHVTFIKSTNLDTNWSWLQLRAMQVGGNASARSFFSEHGCTTTDAQQKYNSRAAKLYRDKLLSQAQHAMRLHGTKVHLEDKEGKTKLHIDVHSEPTSPDAKAEVDFFSEHTKDTFREDYPIAADQKLSAPEPVKNGTLGENAKESDVGPSVEAALSTSPSQAAAQIEPRKTIIGAKKPAAAKKGKGLGAQKVKANFNEIETRAQQLDKEREEYAKNQAIHEARTQEEREKQMASMRLAYQDMSLERKKQEEKLKASDPKKAQQLERLGMGFISNKGISHSAISDMQTIQQEAPSRSRNKDQDLDLYSTRSSTRDRDRDFFEDELDAMSGLSSKRGGGDSLRRSRMDDFGWGNANKGGSWDIDTFEQSSSLSEPIAPKSDDSMSQEEQALDSNDNDSTGSSRSRRTVTDSNSSITMSEEDKKKYANAKAISSDQFFGNRDADLDVKQNLARLEGKSGISSDDVFGTGRQTTSRSSYSSTPDLQDIKDGVRQGITKVAGRLSTIANGVVSSLQRNK